MKIYQITETLDIQKTKDGKFKVVDLDSKGTLQTFDNAGDAEEFRDKKRAELAKKEKPPVKKEPVKKKEPPLSKDKATISKTQSSKDKPAVKKKITPTKDSPKVAKKDADLKDLRPYPLGTPSQDKLTAGERRRLAKTGKIKRGGQVYTRKQINLATDDAKKLAKLVKGVDLKAPDKSEKPDTGKGNMDKIKSFGWKITKFLGKLLGGKLAVTVTQVMNVADLEDTLDMYVRVIRQEVRGRDFNTAWKEISSGQNANVNNAYVTAVRKITETLVEGVTLSLSTVAGIALAVKAFAVMGIATGGLGFIMALVAGGAAAWYGINPIIQKFLEVSGATLYFEKAVADEITPLNVWELGGVFDGAQDYLGYLAGSVTAVAGILPGISVSGAYDWGANLIRDDINEDSHSGNAKQAVIDMIKSDPKAMAYYKKGKPKAQQMIAKLNQR